MSDINDVLGVFSKWLELPDPYAVRVALGTVAANYLDGDPVWTMLVGGSGTGKTEAVTAPVGLEHAKSTSTISGPAALLSATPKKERADSSTGGLLRELGDFGLLLIKDFTSVLSMHREARAEVLGGLREIYDGRWDRHVGVEGGKVLRWEGKVGVLAGCTSALDSAHAFISAMGDRWLIARMPDIPRAAQGRKALQHVGQEDLMREEIAAAVVDLFPANTLPMLAADLGEEDINRLVMLANLASLARSPVARDYQGELELVMDPEAPTRIVKELAQLYRGLTGIGVDQAVAWSTVARVSLDCIPKLRRAVLDALVKVEEFKTSEVAEAVTHPTKTTKRALEDLAAHGLVEREAGGEGKADIWRVVSWARSAHQAALATKPETSEHPFIYPDTPQDDISGQVAYGDADHEEFEASVDAWAAEGVAV